MIQVGDKVMVRDPWIKEDHHVPPAEVLEVKEDTLLLRKTYLLKFENGATEWFHYWALKIE